MYVARGGSLHVIVSPTHVPYIILLYVRCHVEVRTVRNNLHPTLNAVFFKVHEDGNSC